VTSTSRWTRVRKDDNGAEIVEFALVAPLVLLMIFGLIYGMLATGAQLSLSYATSVAARYASIPTAGSTYPTPAQVGAKLADSTPFFGTGACTTTIAGSSGVANSPMTISATCNFPNPLGGAVAAIRGVITGTTLPNQPDTLALTASAQSRKE
jgi:Flp pilus assembly protein TadG